MIYPTGELTHPRQGVLEQLGRGSHLCYPGQKEAPIYRGDDSPLLAYQLPGKPAVGQGQAYRQLLIKPND